ncbi:MAG: response regulator [Candidatus Omnitrophota bacterium]
MENDRKIKVLVVDDEQVVRDFLARFLALKSAIVKIVEDGFMAIEAARQERFDLVFLDVKMPQMNGLETFRELKKIDPAAKYVMMTGYAVDDLLQKARQEGAAHSINKPFDIQQISSIIENFAC